LVKRYPKILTDAKEKRKDRILSYELGMLNFELNLKPKLGKKDTKGEG